MDPRKKSPVSLRRTFNQMLAGAVALWTAACAGSMAYHIFDSKRHIIYLAHETATESVEKDLLYRYWAASHGGVYVPVTKTTQPSPYLAGVKERDITTPSGRRLTLINPANMTRQVHELGRNFTEVQGHISSLEPLRRENAPDAWESKALRIIKAGAKEFGEVTDYQGHPHYRLMYPLSIVKPCLACHGAQGYQLGDLRGGISASIPMKVFAFVRRDHLLSEAKHFGGIWALGFVGAVLVAPFVRRRIKELERVEEALHRNLDFTKSIIENEPECVKILGPQGEVKFMNRAGLAMIDAESIDAVLGQPVQQLVVPEHREAFIRLNERVFAGERGSLEFEMVGLKGTRLWLDTYAVPLRDKAGRVESLLGITRDVTERKRVEQALRKSEERLREAQHIGRIGNWELDVVSQDLWWSDEVYVIFGMDPTNGAVFDAFLRRIHPDDRERVRGSIRDAVRLSLTSWQTEYRLVLDNGEIRHIYENAAAELDHKGSVIRRLGIIQDISERKRAEEALRESEERFRSIFEDSPIAIWEENFSAVKERFDELRAFGMTDVRAYLERNPEEVAALAGRVKVKDINNASVTLLGATSKEEVFRDLPRYFTAASLAVFKEEMIALAEGKTQFKSEVTILDVHGKEKLIDLTVAVQPGHERTLDLVLVSFLDITERKGLERQLLQAQKMDSVGRLAGGIAHDINNMLTPILGYAELLENELPAGDARREDLAEITSAARRIRDMTKQLLAFARKQTLEMVRLNINEVVSGFTRMLQMTLRENIALTVRLAPSVRYVLGDKGQLEQVIMNLAVNAQDAMPSGGTLTFATQDVILDEAYTASRTGMTPGVYVQLRVSDTGVGIDADTISNIFDPFFTTKEVGRGTGLGLAMVYGSVKQHGGYIEIASEPGAGSTFTISLPVSESLAGPAAEMAHKQRHPGSETVLVVEDQEQVLRLASMMLTRNGYRVLTALSGRDALQKAVSFAGEIHLMISDVIMPDMNGKELFERIQEVRKDIRVVYMSGYPADVISSHGVLDSGINFIRKPFSVQELTAKVRQVLDSRGM